MSCLNTTGPVDIIHPDNIIYCTETCKMTYNFKSTAITVANKGTCLSIEPINKTSEAVTYSSTNAGNCNNGGEGKYAVQEIRIYCATNPGGSLHKYDQTRATGEVIIHLNNIIGSGDLIICIPISSSNGTLPKATRQLTSIITKALSTANSQNEVSGQLSGVELKLNQFIPKNSGFYSYTATLPYPPCTNCVNYIVYSLPDAIFLDTNTIEQLTGIINRLAPPIHSSAAPNLGYSYNKKGAIHTSMRNGETVMDCQPIGSNGEILISENKDGPSSLISGLTPEAQAQFKHGLMIFSIIVLSLIVLGLILFGLPKLIASLGWQQSSERITKFGSKLKSPFSKKKIQTA
tara:strand:+ start:713 stop:1753 length:1041 start_codon:yes stop_codon:yes gene_type:complete